MTDRIPPHDLDMEAAVVSACLLSRDALDEVVGIFRPEHCYSNANRLLLEAAFGLHGSGVPVDLVSVANWIRERGKLQQVGGTQYIAQVVDATPAVAHAAAHVQKLIELWRLRQLISECHSTASEGYGLESKSIQQFIDEHEQRVFELGHTQAGVREPVGAKQIATECYRSIKEAYERGSELTGLPSGFYDLDRKTTGTHSGDLWVIAGRPGQGKTALAVGIALNLARSRATGLSDVANESGDATAYSPGTSVAYFSLEMPKEQIGYRLLAAEARVDLGRIRSGHPRQDDWSRLTSALATVGEMPIWVDDTPGLTMLELRAKARRLRAEVVVIDHLGLMHGTGNTREQEVSSLSRSCKELAKELGIPVFALHQLNRDCEKRPDKRPQLSDLRDSGSVEQDADVVLFLYRDEYYTKDKCQEPGVAELIVAKQRNGPTGVVKLKWTSDCTRFDNLTSEQYDEFDSAQDAADQEYYP